MSKFSWHLFCITLSVAGAVGANTVAPKSFSLVVDCLPAQKGTTNCNIQEIGTNYNANYPWVANGSNSQIVFLKDIQAECPATSYKDFTFDATISTRTANSSKVDLGIRTDKNFNAPSQKTVSPSNGTETNINISFAIGNDPIFITIYPKGKDVSSGLQLTFNISNPLITCNPKNT